MRQLTTGGVAVAFTVAASSCGGHSSPAGRMEAPFSAVVDDQPTACGEPLRIRRLEPPSVANTTVVLCQDDSSSAALKAWRPNAYLKLVELRNIVYGAPGAFSIELRRIEDCPEVAGHGCFGREGVVYCQEAFLAKFLFTTASYVTHIVLQAIDRLSDVPQSQADPLDRTLLAEIDVDRFGPMEATALVAAHCSPSHERVARMGAQLHRLAQVYGEQGARQIMERAIDGAEGVRELDMDPTGGLRGLEGDMKVVLGSTWWLYQATANYVLSFVLAHEITHAQKGCAARDPSHVEDSGVLQRLAGYQAGREIGCSNPPTFSELDADRCGLRALRRSVSHQDEHVLKRAFVALENVGRRLSIELLADILLVGSQRQADQAYRPEVHEGRLSYWPVTTPTKGYLNAATRLLLFSQELRSGAPQNRSAHVAVCGQAAERLAEAYLRSYSDCVAHGGLGATWSNCYTPLGLPVAKGVEEFFWTQSSADFRCANGVVVP